MPTYTVSAIDGRLTDTQKASLASALTDIHCRLTSAPKYFVQVIFVDVPATNYFVAGKRLAHDNIFIHGQIRGGRPIATKHQIIEEIMAAVADIAVTDSAATQVYIIDVPAEQVAEWGRILPRPGEEASWDAAIPEEVRARMQSLL